MGHALIGTEAVHGIVDTLADRVIGRDPKNVLAIREELFARTCFGLAAHSRWG